MKTWILYFAVAVIFSASGTAAMATIVENFDSGWNPGTDTVPSDTNGWQLEKWEGGAVINIENGAGHLGTVGAEISGKTESGGYNCVIEKALDTPVSSGSLTHYGLFNLYDAVLEPRGGLHMLGPVGWQNNVGVYTNHKGQGELSYWGGH